MIHMGSKQQSCRLKTCRSTARGTVVGRYLAAAWRPDALCTWITSVTDCEAAPPPGCTAVLTGLCLYRMHTSSSPVGRVTDKHSVQKTGYVFNFSFGHGPQLTWGQRLKRSCAICSGNQGQGENLRLVGMLPLRCDHGAQLGQRQQSFGHQLVPHIRIIISGEGKEKDKN